jgi:CO/xanthine dehydrogenase Mo-binding subunit
MDPADISVTYSDSDHGLPSTGPAGSRYTVMITGAVTGAAKIIKEKLKRVASHMLEAGPHDLEFRDGKIGVKGASGLEVSIAEVATQAHFFRPSLPDDPHLTSGLDASYTYDHPLATLPKSDSDFGFFYPIMGHMCHMPVVAVDIKTGQVTFLDYVAVHDCGTMVNPMTVDTSSPYTEYGVKGAGRGRPHGGAVACAIEDAMRPLGVRIDSLPITPARLRSLIREAE